MSPMWQQILLLHTLVTVGVAIILIGFTVASTLTSDFAF